MSNNNDYSGCVIPIVIIAAITAFLIAIAYGMKAFGELLKESPGFVFVVLVLIVLIGVAYLKESK